MCGYFGNLFPAPATTDLMHKLGVPQPYPEQRVYKRKTFPGLVTMVDGETRLTRALWWFALKRHEGQLIPNKDFTSFNAEDLDNPLWRMAVKTRRALVFATEIIETHDNTRYLMRSDSGFALGCLYNDWLDAKGKIVRSFAIITRPSQQRLRKYRFSTLPLFLPMDQDLIRDWLDPTIHTNAFVQDILENSRLTVDLNVTAITRGAGKITDITPQILHADDSDKVRIRNAERLANIS